MTEEGCRRRAVYQYKSWWEPASAAHHDSALGHFSVPSLLIHAPQVGDPLHRHLIHALLPSSSDKFEPISYLRGKFFQDISGPGVLLFGEVIGSFSKDKRSSLVRSSSRDMSAVLEMVAWVLEVIS